MKKKKVPAKSKEIPPEFRDQKGRFLHGKPGGPGRPPLPIDLENLRAILGVISVEVWKDLARQKVQEAKNGDVLAFAWIERRTLGDANLAELLKAELGVVGEDPLKGKDLKTLSEEVLRAELIRLHKRAQEGRLSQEESAQVLEIRKVLNEVQEVEKLPDLSGVPGALIEEGYFKEIAKVQAEEAEAATKESPKGK